jgi:hypothetical protein
MHADVSCIKSRTLPSSLDEERERWRKRSRELFSSSFGLPAAPLTGESSRPLLGLSGSC